MTLYEIAIVEEIKDTDGDVTDMKVLVAPTTLVAPDEKAVAMEAILEHAAVCAEPLVPALTAHMPILTTLAPIKRGGCFGGVVDDFTGKSWYNTTNTVTVSSAPGGMTYSVADLT